MKKKRVPLAMGQAIDMAVLPRKSLADAKQTPKLRAFAAANGLDETAELVMLPFLPPSPVANSKYGDIVYDQAAFCASFNAQGRWKPIDLGHALLFDAAAPSQGWVATHSGDAEPLSPSEAQRERFARAANVTLSKT